MKNNISEILGILKDKKIKKVAMLAPSFVAEFDYPSVINQLKDLGVDAVVELTFGAKMINRDYHKILEKSKGLVISTTCPGIVSIINSKYPQYKKNLIKVDNPMIATSKICRKIYPKHKTIFISPCNYKKIEAENSKYVDYVIDYRQLQEMFTKLKIKKCKERCIPFDRFYNDYTKIYPLSGGLSKTAHIKGILKDEESFIIDGIADVEKWLKNPDKKIKFLDVTFCKAGCIGGPCITNKLSLEQRKKKVLQYMNIAKKEDIPNTRLGTINKAKGIKFTN